ncbi:MAG: hypothetical protein M1831_007601 [Alyxoria varia]|nr:MAG: hypothetical protein M1831_007601 [Alyxoria varia]
MSTHPAPATSSASAEAEAETETGAQKQFPCSLYITFVFFFFPASRPLCPSSSAKAHTVSSMIYRNTNPHNQLNDILTHETHTSTIQTPFPTPRLARIALQALSVDEELSPLVRRSFSLSSSYTSIPAMKTAPANAYTNATATAAAAVTTDEPQIDATDAEDKRILITHYRATTNRMLRVSVTGFFESLGVVIGCMRELDNEVVGAEWVGEGGGNGGGQKETKADWGEDGQKEGGDEVDRLERVQGLSEGGVLGGPEG